VFLIDVAGFTIWGQRNRVAPSPVFITEDGFTGWDDTPDMRRSSIDRPNAHGEFDAVGYLTARTASFSGHVVTGSALETAALGQRMRGLLSDGSLGRVTVQRDDHTEWADGRLASSTKFTVHGSDPTVADWQMQFWFPDPRKYGAMNHETSSSGALVTRHFGNTRASTRFVVSGDAERWRITGPGDRSVLVTQRLYPGHPHVYDMATGQLVIEGVVQYGGVEVADSWTVPAGRQLNHTLSATGSATAEAFTYDTYV
jgi:hypothetical protein